VSLGYTYEVSGLPYKGLRLFSEGFNAVKPRESERVNRIRHEFDTLVPTPIYNEGQADYPRNSLQDLDDMRLAR